MKYFSKAIMALMFLYIQQTTAQNAANDSVDDKTVTLREAVISVNKSEDTKKTIAQQVLVIGSREMSALQAQTTADVLANTGEVFIQKSQSGGGSVTLRGFEANRNLLVIDGIRMNNLIYRGGHLQNIITTDNNSLDRIEVLFGPSSTIYGSDALGGVIHLVTKKPLLSTGDKRLFKLGAFTRFSNVNSESTSHFDFNIGGKKWASFTSLTWSAFDDLRGGRNQNPFYNGSYGERPFYGVRINNRDSLVKNADRYNQVRSGYTQYDIIQKFLYQQNKNTSHELNLQYSNSSDIPRYDRLTDPAGAGLAFAEWYYGPQTRLLTAYDLNVKNINGKLQSIHAGINFQDITESRHTRRWNSTGLSHRNEEVKVLGVNVDYQRTYTDHKIRLGLDAQYNTLTSTAESENIVTGVRSPLDTRYPDGENSMTSAALYFSHTWKINETTTLVDGFRIGIVSLNSIFIDTTFFKFPFNTASQFNPVFSGNVGIISSPSDDWKLSMLLSTGYRVPNVDDMSKVFETVKGAVTVPNPDIRPERSISYELGCTRIMNKKTRWESAVYYTQFLNAIVRSKFQYNGADSIMYDGVLSQVYANQNKNQAYIYGVSSNIKSILNEHLVFVAGLAYTYGRIKTDSSDYPLDHIPPFTSRASLVYTIDKFRTDFFVNYHGWKRLKDYYLNGEDNEQYATPSGMPAWFTVNLRINYQVDKRLNILVGIDNIFDTQYRTFASGINAPGRNVFGTLKWTL